MKLLQIQVFLRGAPAAPLVLPWPYHPSCGIQDRLVAIAERQAGGVNGPRVFGGASDTKCWFKGRTTSHNALHSDPLGFWVCSELVTSP